MDNTEDDTIPQTDTVFDQPALEFDSHTWRQEGYMLVDICGTHPSQGIPIEAGTMLIKEGDRYKLVHELTRT